MDELASICTVILLITIFIQYVLPILLLLALLCYLWVEYIGPFLKREVIEPLQDELDYQMLVLREKRKEKRLVRLHHQAMGEIDRTAKRYLDEQERALRR